MRVPKRVRWLAVLVVVVVASGVTWYLAAPLFIVTRGTEAPPAGFATVLATGQFVNGEPGHHASGLAEILTDGGTYVVRLSSFSVTNGPDIHVFLARAPRVGAGDADLGSVRVTEGSANYGVPGGVDPRAYGYVVIWCVPFQVQFGYAALTFG